MLKPILLLLIIPTINSLTAKATPLHTSTGSSSHQELIELHPSLMMPPEEEETLEEVAQDLRENCGNSSVKAENTAASSLPLSTTVSSGNTGTGIASTSASSENISLPKYTDQELEEYYADLFRRALAKGTASWSTLKERMRWMAFEEGKSLALDLYQAKSTILAFESGVEMEAKILKKQYLLLRQQLNEAIAAVEAATQEHASAKQQLEGAEIYTRAAQTHLQQIKDWEHLYTNYTRKINGAKTHLQQMQANKNRKRAATEALAKKASNLEEQRQKLHRQAISILAQQMAVINSAHTELQEAQQELEELQADTPLRRAQAQHDLARQRFNEADRYCREQYTTGLQQLRQAMFHEAAMKLALSQYEELARSSSQENAPPSLVQQTVLKAASNPDLHEKLLISFQNDIDRATACYEELKTQFMTTLTPAIINRMDAEEDLQQALDELAAALEKED